MFEIKEVEASNLEQFLDFAKKFILNQFFDYPQNVRNAYWKYDFNRENLLKQIEKDEADIFVAIVDKKIVGFSVVDFYYGGQAHMKWIGILEDYRGEGIGTALLLKIEENLKKHYCHFITIWTETKKNVEFYKKRGYYLIGLQKESWFGIDEYLMQKNLRKPFEEIFKN